MRFLGIDYGTKRIGLAISDENHSLAFPKEIILNDRNVFKHIGDILRTENISEVVVGESLDFSGQPNPISREIEDFISKLKEQFGVKVHNQKEFLTSVEARRYNNSKERQFDQYRRFQKN